MGLKLFRSILLILFFSISIFPQQPTLKSNEKFGLVSGFPDMINIKYQYYFTNKTYIGGISFISMTRTFDAVPLNLPSLCLGYEPFHVYLFSSGIEMVTTFWVWDQVMKGSIDKKSIDVHANHLILTLRPYISIGKTWGFCLTGGISYIKNWDYGKKYGSDYRGFYNETTFFPSFGCYLWFNMN